MPGYAASKGVQAAKLVHRVQQFDSALSFGAISGDLDKEWEPAHQATESCHLLTSLDPDPTTFWVSSHRV
jgi:hypothetical protein